MDILIASLQKNVQTAVEMLLSDKEDMTVVGLVDTTTELLDQASTIYPDLVLVEWDLLGSAGVNTIRNLDWLSPRPDVVVYGRRSDWAHDALESGADAFVWEGDGPNAMLATIRKVYHDGRGKSD